MTCDTIIENLEEKYKNGDYGDLVADNHGVYFSCLGYVGCTSLVIPEDMENMIAKLAQKPAAPAQGNKATRQEQENQTPPNKSQEQAEPVLPEGGIALAEDPEKNEAEKARKKATEVVQRCDELSGYQRTNLIKEAIALMHTAGIITDEQDAQLNDLIQWGKYYTEIEIKLIATAIYEAADNYVMTGAATVEIRTGDNISGVKFEELKTAYDIADRANSNAFEAVKLREVIRKEMGKLEEYNDSFLRTGLIQFYEYADSCRNTINIKQESLKKELEAARTTIEKLESYIVPDIVTLQELQEIVDKTMTGTDEVNDLEGVAGATYVRIKNRYESAERMRDRLRSIFNTAT